MAYLFFYCRDDVAVTRLNFRPLFQLCVIGPRFSHGATSDSLDDPVTVQRHRIAAAGTTKR
jgi:hypothetical protein